jgi:hypothetical protein
MQNIRYSFLFVIGLVLIFGTASATFSQKKQKNVGYLSVKSSPDSYPVKINGEIVGMSGTNRGAEFPLRADDYLVEVEGPDGQVFKKEVTIRKNERNCICLTVRKEITSRPCPYNIVVDVDNEVYEGDTVTFSSHNLVQDTIPVNYRWTVSGGTITGGQGTSSITVDTRGMGGQTITAFLDVTDDVYGSTCFQKNSAKTYVKPPPELPKPIPCDLWESKSADDDKARFDNCNLAYRQTPNSQIYIILYQGTDKRSISVDKLAKRALDYFVKNLGVPASQIVLTRGGNRPRTSAQVWIVPPGAQPPPVQ